MSSVLITGGAGFVGSHLAEALVAAGRRIVLYDNFATATPQSVAALGDRAELVTGDVLDLGHLTRTLRRHEVAQVVHGAAVVGAPASLERPLFTTRVNIEGSLTVFEACLLTNVERVVDLSSEEVYGTFETEAVDEDAPQRPISPYGIGKHTVEALAAHYARHLGLPYVAARLSWVYGPRFPRSRLPQAWLADALAGRASALAHGGDHLIDFTHVDDVVRGLRLLLEAQELRHSAYHVATGTATSVRDLAEEIRTLLPTWRVRLGDGLLEQAPGYTTPAKGALLIDRVRDELGYEPRVDLAAGLARDLEQLVAHGGAPR